LGRGLLAEIEDASDGLVEMAAAKAKEVVA
jgi:hypothetical protein